jgi:hypothetical protein
MMGLEPTTFCMANGSWVRVSSPANPYRLGRKLAVRRPARTDRKHGDLRSIRGTLGTRPRLVPNQKLGPEFAEKGYTGELELTRSAGASSVRSRRGVSEVT